MSAIVLEALRVVIIATEVIAALVWLELGRKERRHGRDESGFAADLMVVLMLLLATQQIIQIWG